MDWTERCNPQVHVAGAARQTWPWHDALRTIHDHELLLFDEGWRGSIAWDGARIDIAGASWVLIPPGLPHICRGAGPGVRWRAWVHFDWDYSATAAPLPLLTYAPERVPPARLRPAPDWAPLRGVAQGRIAGLPAVRERHGRIAAAWLRGDAGGRAEARGGLLALLVGLLAPAPRAGSARPGLAWAVREALDALADAPMAEADALATALARLGRDPDHAARAFRAVFGIPPLRYLTAQRMQRAQDLLAAGVRPVEAARRLGFADPGYFNRVFRRFAGVAPGRWAAPRRD